MHCLSDNLKTHEGIRRIRESESPIRCQYLFFASNPITIGDAGIPAVTQVPDQGTTDTISRDMSPSQPRPITVNPHQAMQPVVATRKTGADRIAAHSDATKGTPNEYFGESSTFNFVANVGSPLEGRQESVSAASGARPPPTELHTSLAASSPSVPVFELLGSDCEDPFGLPSRFVADRLVDAYFRFRHPLNPYLHEGTFRQRYRSLWLSQDVGGEEATQQTLAWFGLVNLVFAFGSDHASTTGRSAADRSRYFKRAKCLIFSGLLQMGTIELVQALLLMGQYLHGSLELNDCWTVVGLAIRTAQGLGLHLDPAKFTTNRIEQEVRKRIWWGCFVLDRVLGIKVGRPTMPDGPGLEVGMPLAVDDEFLSNSENSSSQPQGVPSKLEYFNQVILQCRLMEKILETLYGEDSSQGNTQKARAVHDPPRFLALSVQLDGELVAWQENLPRHLKPEAQALDWHFERQRNILMMRFLHARHLVHRQTLLLYITRRVKDPFQQEIMRTCVKRCITAAYDSITQVSTLHQHNKLSPFWHNSHYVFAALGVLLVYHTVEPTSVTEISLPPNVDIDHTIRQGVELLSRVGGQMHPLASRYVQSIQQLQARLKVISASNKSQPSQTLPTAQKRNLEADAISSVPQPQPPALARDQYPPQAQVLHSSFDPSMQQEVYQPTFAEASRWTGFEDEFSNIENMLMDSTGWTGLMDDWSDTPVCALDMRSPATH
ncbi:hypothetical protein H2200_002797 [Cladophialophora chaetospira]|uniref:Xylanolytic transcriptional activator regulatory domain-containing protein n=1 Tax=Cladophialophora chaetospira TaxID=386627 RepID=A0AA39CNX0_9EURO|nr:hypothetical protein H2200_002797 [Cladophialophora chaetospira]